MAVRKKAQDSYFKDLEKYYKLKSDYELKYQKEKKKILGNTNYKTVQDKREKLQKLKLPCSQCKRKVGMNFETTPTHFTCGCGDETQPCEFRINLKKYKVVTQYPLLEALKKDCDKNMLDIIKLKLDVLFNFASESEISTKFATVRDDYMKNNKLYKNTVNSYKEVINREPYQEELNKKKIELQNELLEMKDILNRFNQDGKDQFLIEYIDRYQRIITPIIEKIRELSYSYQNVEFDGNDEVFRLIQEPYTVHDLEIFIKRTK
tara:strand:- start:11512 stop:12300 length:789 start_codon:yes stop_codon:yes gene_type:complete